MDEFLSVTKIDDRQVDLLGDRGEQIAAGYLVDNGYRIVLTNFKVPIGRNSKGVARSGEIDIIAIDRETLCFVEVKSRTSEDFASAITNVDLRKRIQITRTSRMYRSIFHVRDTPVRFDVVTVVMPPNAAPKITLIKGFWSESTLRSQRKRVRDDIPY